MTARRIVVITFALIIAVAVVAGFRILGTPIHQRNVATDDLEVNQMRSLASAAAVNVRGAHANAYTNSWMLRSDLGAAVKAPTVEYRRVDSTHFELCGTFREASEPSDLPYERPYAHPAGHVCFRYNTAVIPLGPELVK